MIWSRFIGGSSIHTAIKLAHHQRWLPIFDAVKEGSKTPADVESYYKGVLHDINATPVDQKLLFALKLSSFTNHPEYMHLIQDILGETKKRNIKVLIDAEEDARKNIEKETIENLSLSGFKFYKTYQMYRKDAATELRKDLDTNMVHHFKIVRGAYMHRDKKHDVLHSTKDDVDKAYNEAIVTLLDAARNRPDVKILIATHNSDSIHLALKQADKCLRWKEQVAFAQLLGMGDMLTKKVIDRGYFAYKYVPYGNPQECLPYLSRRLLENIDIIKHIPH
jgi:hypothetical protein